MVTAYHGKFIGGRLCLDFVNTVGGRTAGGAVIRDKIGGCEDLLAWGRAAGIPGVRTAGANVRGPKRAIRLREALYRVFTRRRPAAADLDVLRSAVAVARANQEFTLRGRRFIWSFRAGLAVNRILWQVAMSAAELLTSGELSRVRQCSGPDCRWLFLDTSRNGRRRWCDMQDCGNRAKVQRFRAKAIVLPD